MEEREKGESGRGGMSQMSMRSAVVVVSQCLPHGAARVQGMAEPYRASSGRQAT